MRCRNQIEFFVNYEADRNMKFLQYDHYVYQVVYQGYQCTCALRSIFLFGFTVDTGPNQTWEFGREKITTEYEKRLSLICFVNEFPKTKRRKYPQYASEQGCVIMRNSNWPFIPANDYNEINSL